MLQFFKIFPDFLFSGLGWTGDLWLNCIVLILKNEEDFLFISLIYPQKKLFKKLIFLRKKVFFCDFFNFAIFLTILKKIK